MPGPRRAFREERLMAQTEFHKLWAASAASNLSDGITLVAAPLLAASLTRDPALVAGLAFAQRLPWLLFALLSGALADRLDRRRAMDDSGESKRSGLGQFRQPGRSAQVAEPAAAAGSARAGRGCRLPAVDGQPQCVYSGGCRPRG
jgi:hypothetical protein